MTSKAGDEHLIVFINEVEAAIARHECGDLLAVLNELNAAALADGGIGLLGLDVDLFVCIYIYIYIYVSIYMCPYRCEE